MVKYAVENDKELHSALWCCLSALSDTPWSYQSMDGMEDLTELEWVQDGVVHVLEFLEKRYGLEKGDAERLAKKSYDEVQVKP